MVRTGAPIIVHAVVSLFGVASAVLGFIAEATRLKPDDMTTSGCVYPDNPAFQLALCAAFLLVVSLIVASAAGGCCMPGATGVRAPQSNLILGITASILSWVGALITMAFYVQGMACYHPKAGWFLTAGVLSLVTTALGNVSIAWLTHRPSAMASAAGYGPRPDGHYPPAVEMQPGPYGHQGYGQQPAYGIPAPCARASAHEPTHAYEMIRDDPWSCS